MYRALIVGSLSVLSLTGCLPTEERQEGEGDSQSNLVVIDGPGRVSVTVAVTKAGEGVPAQVTVQCGPANDRTPVAGEGDAEGNLFPILRPEDCVIIATIAATDPEKAATTIELRHPGRANVETVETKSAGGYTATATFGEAIR